MPADASFWDGSRRIMFSVAAVLFAVGAANMMMFLTGDLIVLDDALASAAGGLALVLIGWSTPPRSLTSTIFQIGGVIGLVVLTTVLHSLALASGLSAIVIGLGVIRWVWLHCIDGRARGRSDTLD